MNVSEAQKNKLKKGLSSARCFLQALYRAKETRQVKDILNFSTSKELKVLISVLQHIAQGAFALSRHSFKILKEKSKLETLHNQLGTNARARELLRGSREKQLRYLYKLAGVFRELLSAISASKPPKNEQPSSQSSHTVQ